jgi:hypothetical protein
MKGAYTMSAFIVWIVLGLAVGLLILMIGDWKFTQRLGFGPWERVWFELEKYGPLRDQGLTHKEAIKELDREWRRRTVKSQ